MRVSRRKGASPLYSQVADLLRARLEDGELQPGDRLDSEPRLVQELQVSRATVSKALDLLEAEGRIRREQGRGTFVADVPMERPLPELTGFSEHVRSLGLRPGHRLLGLDRVLGRDGDPLAEPFGPDAELLAIRRLRLVDGRPVGLHRTLIPADIARLVGATPQRLAAPQVSLYALFAEYGVRLHAAEERLRARVATADEARLLETAPGEALMEVLRFSRDDRGRLVEAVDARYLAALYTYRIDLVRRPNPTEHQETTDDPVSLGPAGSLHLAGQRVR